MTRKVENVGIGGVYATFEIDKTDDEFDLTAEDEGSAVALSGDNETDHGADDDPFLGQLVSVQDDIAVVQVKGVVRAPYDATAAPVLGGAVAVNGVGKVKAAASGRGFVIALDATAETADVLL